MKFKFVVFTFCLIQIHTWTSESFVSAYPQPINPPKDTTQQQQQQLHGEGAQDVGNKGTDSEGVDFQIHQNQIHDDNDKDDCLEKKRVGPCKASIPKYYFDQGSGRCEPFLYGGCDGSNNKFGTLRDCEQKCAKHLRTAQQGQEPITIHNEEDQSLSVVATCELPHTEEGASCKGYVPRWTFDPVQIKCVQFMYQGCGATKNNFRSKALCEQACGDYVFQKSGVSSNLKSGPNEVCKLPLNPGPCYALYSRYYFNQVNNRCEKFVFGGCGGNENNFKSGDDCVRACGGDEPAHDTSCSNIDCPWSRFTHYTALGCKPIYDSNACCPTRFDCPDSNLTSSRTGPQPEQPKPKCRYQGKLYSIGDPIKDASSAKDCRASCTCSSFGDKAKIQCINIECPEQLGAVPPGKESCHRLYKRDGCCVDSYYCPNDTSIEKPPQNGALPPPPPVEPYECHLEGKTYFEGERMYPQKSKCLKCLCQKGFNGNLTEEFCDKIDCGIEIYYSDQLERDCAPVYFQDSNGIDNCCPISWKCPDEQKITLPLIPKPTINTPSRELTPPAQTVPIPGPITILPIPFGTNISDIVPIASTRNDVLTAEACKLPKVVGPCRAHRPRFFFNTTTDKCEGFTYGGCKGNQNNFVALSDCEKICEANTDQTQEDEGSTPKTQQPILSRAGQVQIQPVPVQTPTTYKLTETDPCEQSVRTGPCRAYLPRYYFSPEENACKFFVFGGCKGNENNFYSHASCEAKCLNKLPEESLRYEQTNALRSSLNGDSSRVTFDSSQEQQQRQQRPQPQHQRPPNFNIIDATPSKDICGLRAVTGRCRAHVKRFYFDGTRCTLFTYGGCGGNANNFRNFDECNQKCGGGAPLQQQQQQQQILPANFKSPKWRSAAIPESANQQPVVFGGTERCQLPPKVGSCYGMFKSYYYDVVSRSCQNFTYGGCFGNTNRFVALEECKATCERPLALERQNELTLARSGNAHILPVDDEDDQSQQMVQGRQLMPGEVIVIQPGQKPQSIANVTTEDETLDEKVFCGLAPEKGPCKSNELRYFWDSNSRTCLPFFYGGCRGNKNNFLSESDCLSGCGAGPTLEQIVQDGVLSCTFGNETFELGATLGHGTSLNDADGEDGPCGIPICSCQIPPSLICIQKACKNPAQAVTIPLNMTDNVNGATNDFEVERVSVPAGPASSSTPNWSKPIDKIVKG